MILSEREKAVIRQMGADRFAAIRRKRSWRPSEKAIAVAEVRRLIDKITGLEEST